MVGGAGTNGFIGITGSEVTVRNNVLLMHPGTGWSPFNVGALETAYAAAQGMPQPTNIWLYQNTIYYPATSPFWLMQLIGDRLTNSEITVKNNLMCSPNNGATQDGKDWLWNPNTTTVYKKPLRTNPLLAEPQTIHCQPTHQRGASEAIGGKLPDWARRCRFHVVGVFRYAHQPRCQGFGRSETLSPARPQAETAGSPRAGLGGVFGESFQQSQDLAVQAQPLNTNLVVIAFKHLEHHLAGSSDHFILTRHLGLGQLHGNLHHGVRGQRLSQYQTDAPGAEVVGTTLQHRSAAKQNARFERDHLTNGGSHLDPRRWFGRGGSWWGGAFQGVGHGHSKCTAPAY